MGNNATTNPGVRELPIYREAFAAGRDVGLRDALDCITAERIRLNRTPNGRCVPYADAALARVQTAIANHFLHGSAS